MLILRTAADAAERDCSAAEPEALAETETVNNKKLKAKLLAIFIPKTPPNGNAG
jgi:hypothetical protein